MVLTQCGHEVRIFLGPAAFRSAMFALASSWYMYSLPVRLAGSPVHFSFDSTPNFTPQVRRIANIDLSDFWKSASNDPAQPSQTITSCFAGSNVSSSADATDLVR